MATALVLTTNSSASGLCLVFFMSQAAEFGGAMAVEIEGRMGELLVGYPKAGIACGNGNSYGLGTSADDKYVDTMVFISERAILNHLKPDSFSVETV